MGRAVRNITLCLGIVAGAAACRSEPNDGSTTPRASDSGTFVKTDASDDNMLDSGVGPSADAGAPSVDAGTTLPDASSLPADAGTPLVDAGSPSSDAGQTTGPACDEVTFSYDNAQATSVWLTGSFTGWAADLASGALEMTRMVGGPWTVTHPLGGAGRYHYKYIIDGSTWVTDPNAPQEDDGGGNVNNVVEVCAGGLSVLSHQTDTAARTFSATVEYRGAADPATAVVTVDLAAAPSGAVTVQGTNIQIALGSLTDGIHDVRVRVGDDEILLKVYINESTDWRDTVMYFVMTDRFRNGDTGNDAPVGGTLPGADYMGGDFAGVTAAIEGGYFERLGVNSLWLTWPADNPEGSFDGLYPTGNGCNPSGQETGRFSGYHGYWPSDPRSIEARFGTMAELQALVTAAHARGIRILLDFTANHMHTDWSEYQSHTDWFNQPPTMCRDGHWDDHLKEECWFEPYLADWDYTNADARDRVIDDAVWMIRQTGADGFRVDALKHMEDQFLRDLRARMANEIELTGVPFYMVGETFTGDAGAIEYYVNPSMVHAQFDFPSNKSIREGLAIDSIGLGAMHQQVRGIKGVYGSDGALMSTFIGNHDIARFISKATGELGCGIWSVTADRVRAFDSPPGQPADGAPYRKLELAMAYAFAVPGVPLVYYGDEVGLGGAGDPDNRRMMPAAASLNGEQQQALAFMERLGQARASNAVLRTGDWTDALVADDTLLVFARTSAVEKALVVINRGGQRTVDVPVGGIGLSDGAVLAAQLGTGNVTVAGGNASVSIGGGSAEIYVSQ